MSVTTSNEDFLRSEWNEDIDFDSVKHYDSRRFSWKCAKGHEWVSSFHARWYGETKCPYCVGQLTIKGVNSFADLHPDLLEEWDWERNNKDPYEIFPRHGSVWWKCSLGHSWKSAVKTRVDTGTGCAYCEGRKVLKGFNSLKDLHPEIASEWDYDKNTEDIDSISLGNSKSVHWKCYKGHEWKTSVYHRIKSGSKCPVCIGQRVVPGVNSLEAKYPHLVEEWDYSKNSKLPTDISPTYKHKVWWKCSEGHEWKASVGNRAKRNSGCPYCSGRLAIPGESSLLEIYPEIASEWSPRNSVEVGSVRPRAGIKAEWNCSSCGHVWFSVVAGRTNGHGCPRCAKKISKSEESLAEFLESVLGEDEVVRRSRDLIPPYEVDIYIPSKNIAVEFNGIFWHSSKYVENIRRHYDKWKRCSEAGIQLLTIWEDDWRDKQEVVKSMLKHKLGMNTDKRVFARKTEVVEISRAEARKFLESHHIQGYASGKYYLGLKCGNELVSVMVLKRTGNELDLTRYATSCIVVGGQSKFLSWIDKNIDYSRMKTFADLCVSDGSLYERTGWTLDGFLKPDYKYVVKGKREHKFKYRKKRFKNDPNLRYNDNLTEFELAELNGIHRVYDCGKLRYVRHRDTTKG